MKRNIKKTFFSLPAAVCFLMLLASCGYFEARENRSKLADVRIGMTQKEVRTIMGEPPAGVFQGEKVLFYYTSPKWYDGMVTRDECTPFVFDEDEDRLIGFGYDYFRLNHSLADWDANNGREGSWRDSVVPRAKQLEGANPQGASAAGVSAAGASAEKEGTP